MPLSDAKKPLPLEFYRSLSAQDSFRRLAYLRSWFNGLVSYDPRTGEPISTDMDALFEKMTLPKSPHKDYLYPIIFRSELSFKTIIRSLREKILREHRMLPLHQVRQVDSKTIQWISQKPGRTIRQKLSGSAHIKAPIRRLSVDTLENRLLKRFAQVMVPILAARQEALQLENDVFLSTLTHWLYTEECEEIGPWQPSAPNNALLHDNQYRKIWGAWSKLQTLPDLIYKDSERIAEMELQLLFWDIADRFYRLEGFSLLQCPLSFEYEKFAVKFPYLSFYFQDFPIPFTFSALPLIAFFFQDKPLFLTLSPSTIELHYGGLAAAIHPEGQSNWVVTIGQDEYEVNFLDSNSVFSKLKELITPSDQNIKIREKRLEAEKIFIILNSTRPLCRANGKNSLLPALLWVQHWEEEGLWADSSYSEALFIKKEKVINHTWHSLLYAPIPSSEEAGHLGQCLKGCLSTKHLYYFLPEHFHELELKHQKNAVRSAFPNSSPLPPSIAAIFSQERKFTADQWVIFLDFPYNGISITPVQTAYAQNLAEALPETRGILYKRHPTRFISQESFSAPLRNVLNSTSINKELQEELLSLIGQNGLISEKDKLYFVHNQEWVKIPKNISIQYNKPELAREMRQAIEEALDIIRKDGTPVYLAAHPNLKGVFPNAQDLTEQDILEGGEILSQKEAKLKGINPELFLWEDFLPSLTMEAGESVDLVKDVSVRPIYGKPVAIPIGKKPILKEHKASYKFRLIIGSHSSEREFSAFLRSPDFPLQRPLPCALELTYTYGESQPYRLRFIPEDKKFRPIEVEWKEGKEEIDYDALSVPKYPNEEEEPPLDSYPKKGKNLKHPTSNLFDWARKVLTTYLKNEKPDIGGKPGEHRFPFYVLWKYGRSLENTSERYFQQYLHLNPLVQKAKNRFHSCETQRELFYILACMNRDAPKGVYEELLELSRPGSRLSWWDAKGNLRESSLGCFILGSALGALDQPWQRQIFENLFERLQPKEKIGQKYIVIRILATAFWREENLIFNTLDQADRIERSLNILLEIIKDKNIKKYAPICEMLLALMRLRRSDSMEIKKILAPNHPRIKEISGLMSKLTEKDIGETFVTIAVNDSPLPLLEAAQLYLRGEDDSGISFTVEES